MIKEKREKQSNFLPSIHKLSASVSSFALYNPIADTIKNKNPNKITFPQCRWVNRPSRLSKDCNNDRTSKAVLFPRACPWKKMTKKYTSIRIVRIHTKGQKYAQFCHLIPSYPKARDQFNFTSKIVKIRFGTHSKSCTNFVRSNLSSKPSLSKHIYIKLRSCPAIFLKPFTAYVKTARAFADHPKTMRLPSLKKHNKHYKAGRARSTEDQRLR